MGGGGAMRAAAAKIAGISTFAARRHHHHPDAPASFLARTTTAVVSRSDEAALSSQPVSPTMAAAVARKALEEEEWDVVGEETREMEGTAMRIVFGPAPSLEEAKEATSELREAIDKMYFSSPSSPRSADNVLATRGFGYGALSQPDQMEHKARPVIETFMLLKKDPVAQTVVASIACDPNVWNAVLQNEALQGYLMSGAADAVYGDLQSPRSFTDSSAVEDHGSEYGIMDFVEDAKNKVLDMVSKMTDFVHNLFNGPASKNAFGFMEGNQGTVVGGSFMALAVMVIMVVLVKRG
ncbi:hypothetical protein AKJ16_DCAP06040 [Drosera capensis]